MNPNQNMQATRTRQRGVSLFTALIMLLLITVITLTTFKISQTSIQVTGNLQNRDQVVAAANSLIQEAISTVRMVESPETVLLLPCGANENTRCIDVNNDGVNDITAVLMPQPVCVQRRTIPNAGLRPDLNPDDLGCLVTSGSPLGVAGVPTGDSLCAQSVWEVNAVATDALTGAQAGVAQGVGVRVSVDNIDAACPI